MTSHPQAADQLLTVEAAAEQLSTSVRFIRRLIAERRIEFVRVGRHVRIRESALAGFIDAGRAEPMTAAEVQHATAEADQAIADALDRNISDAGKPASDGPDDDDGTAGAPAPAS